MSQVLHDASKTVLQRMGQSQGLLDSTHVLARRIDFLSADERIVVTLSSPAGAEFFKETLSQAAGGLTCEFRVGEGLDLDHDSQQHWLESLNILGSYISEVDGYGDRLSYEFVELVGASIEVGVSSATTRGVTSFNLSELEELDILPIEISARFHVRSDEMTFQPV